MRINPIDFDFREHNFFVRELSYYVIPPRLIGVVTLVYMFLMNIHIECCVWP